jgi:enamine deaminase RidA (YjgF/YER057c/UK114 family)
LGLSLENTVRTRTWGRDAEARKLAVDERSKILTGNSKGSSTSYICPEFFDSTARVAVDLIAMRAANPNAERKPVEFDPPRLFLRSLIYDAFVFLSGVARAGADLKNSLAETIAEIDGCLAVAGTSWDQVTTAAYFLHRSQKIEVLKGLLEKNRRLGTSQTEFCFVNGFAREGILVEVEVTAKVVHQ